VSPANIDQPIEMPFGLRTQVGPKNHVLDVGSDTTAEASLSRKSDIYCKFAIFLPFHPDKVHRKRSGYVQKTPLPMYQQTA